MATNLQIAVQKVSSVNPATGEVLGELQCATKADVLAAVQRARHAQPAWADLGVKKRVAILRDFQYRLHATKSQIAEGITRARLPADNRVICTLNDPSVPERARALGNTRSAAALELWQPDLEGSVVVIGNAPTALFHLLDMLDAGAPKPALILGFPVGFIGAAESKALLAADSRGVPFVALRGRRGGSAMAAAAVNALATETE